MPQSISAPLPHAAATAHPSAREHAQADKQAWHTEPIESRVAAIEARWEVTAPTLATIADLRGVENRLIRWVLGAAFGLLFAVLGIFFAGYTSVNARFDSVNARIDSSAAELRAETRSAIADLRAEIRETREETRSAIAELRTEIRETNTRMESRFERMDAKFDALMSELRSQRNDSR